MSPRTLTIWALTPHPLLLSNFAKVNVLHRLRFRESSVNLELAQYCPRFWNEYFSTYLLTSWRCNSEAVIHYEISFFMPHHDIYIINSIMYPSEVVQATLSTSVSLSQFMFDVCWCRPKSSVQCALSIHYFFPVPRTTVGHLENNQVWTYTLSKSSQLESIQE